MSTTRTVGKAALLLTLLVPIAACSDDDGDDGGTSSTTASTAAEPDGPAGLPDDVAPGRGALVLDGETIGLTVNLCSDGPLTNPETGVVTEFTANAVSDDGGSVDLVSASFTADVPTTTDTITVITPDGMVLESSRADAGGQVVDLRDPGAAGSLFTVDGEGAGRLISAEGVFGFFGSTADDPANVDGALLLRCP